MNRILTELDQKDYVSYSVLINGIEVNAVYSRDSIDGIFLSLLRRLTRMQAEKFMEFSDMRNVSTCLEHSGGADLTLEMTGDGEFRVAAAKARKVQRENSRQS